MRGTGIFVLLGVLVGGVVGGAILFSGALLASAQDKTEPTIAFRLLPAPVPEPEPNCLDWISSSCEPLADGAEKPRCKFLMAQQEGTDSICLGEQCHELLAGLTVEYLTITLVGEIFPFCADADN